MIWLGIDEHDGHVFEGNSSRIGRLVYPAPILVPVILDYSEGSLPKRGSLPREVFREDFFDPISKIRRGRIYSSKNLNPQPMDWTVTDPLHPERNQFHGGMYGERTRLFTYFPDPLLEFRARISSAASPKIILGEEPFMAIWRVIVIEATVDGTPLLTLRPIQSFGDLPAFNPEAIPSKIRKAALRAWEALATCLHTGNAEDRIDRCRDLLSIAFGHAAGNQQLDLAAAIAKWEEQNEKRCNSLCGYCGRIVARLHARGKPNEQVAKSLRAPSDDDAELAVRCAAFVLTEFGWTRACWQNQ